LAVGDRGGKGIDGGGGSGKATGGIDSIVFGGGSG
jgi:hypothetical protein